MSAADAGARRKGVLDLVATALLALATVATAWAGYQARWWTGEQTHSYSKATASRLESTRASALANRQAQIDVATFMQWVDAYARKEDTLATFYRERFRAEFKPAVEAWIATRPLKNPKAPLTPFAMPQYRLAANDMAANLETTAAAFATSADVDNRRATNYMLAVVLFASSLFFAGISTRLHTIRGQQAILALGCLLFAGALIWIVSLPSSLSA